MSRKASQVKRAANEGPFIQQFFSSVKNKTGLARFCQACSMYMFHVRLPTNFIIYYFFKKLFETDLSAVPGCWWSPAPGPCSLTVCPFSVLQAPDSCHSQHEVDDAGVVSWPDERGGLQLHTGCLCLPGDHNGLHGGADKAAIVSIDFLKTLPLHVCAGLTSWVSAPTPRRTNPESRRQQTAVSSTASFRPSHRSDQIRDEIPSYLPLKGNHSVSLSSHTLGINSRS